MKVVKRGILKHDLYIGPTENGYTGLRWHHASEHWLMTEDQCSKLVKEFISRFVMVLPKGTVFEAYDCDGELLWRDAINVGCEESNEWAERNLEIKG